MTAPPPTSLGPPPRWRPPLALLIAGAVAAVLTLPTLGMAAVVALSRSPDALLASLLANWPRIVLAEAVVVVSAALVGYVLWRTLARPIDALARRAEAVARWGSAFDSQGPHGTREIARVATSFAVTVEELQRRTLYLETLTAHLAHELKSPLTAIQGAAELLAEPDMPLEKRVRFARNIGEDAARLTRLVNRLRELARADMGVPESSRIGVANEAVDSPSGSACTSADILAEILDDVATGFEVDLDPDVFLPIGPMKTAVVLGHLVDNARRHGARRLTVTCIAPDVLRIANDGAPISPEVSSDVLTPFFTTRRAEGGTGLGLAIAAAMLRTAGGEITLGTLNPVAFDLRFPPSS